MCSTTGNFANKHKRSKLLMLNFANKIVKLAYKVYTERLLLRHLISPNILYKRKARNVFDVQEWKNDYNRQEKIL